MPTRPTINITGGTESSEYVFSPEKEYKNDKEIAEMLHVDSRGPEVAPFESEERRWNTPPPTDGPWGKAKKLVKKLLRLDKTTVKPAWNVTKELLGDYIIRRMGEMHRYIKYTVLNRPTPNATAARVTTEDPLDFWRAHYTDWAFFNRLHHEIMNASVPEAHWWYRTLMAEAYGVNLDEVETTTPMEFDIHRMDGFSTNVTLPTTVDTYDSEVNSAEFPAEVRAALTLRPAFNNAIDKFLSSINFPTLPQVEIRPGVTGFGESPLFKKLQKKLMSFYYITTRSPEEWTDSVEAVKARKLKKWLAKEEKRVLASVERHLDAYSPDFGPAFNAYYASIRKMSTKKVTSAVEKKSEEKTTKNEIESTFYEPPHVRKAFDEGREVNVTVLQRWLYEHCSNNTIEWLTEAPPTRPMVEADDVIVTERETRARLTRPEGPTGSTLEIFTIPRHAHEKLLHENFTMDREKIDRMLLMASRHLKNLSLFRIEENWERVSKAIHDDQFTTTTEFNSQEVIDMFTHKQRNY